MLTYTKSLVVDNSTAKDSRIIRAVARPAHRAGSVVTHGNHVANAVVSGRCAMVCSVSSRECNLFCNVRHIAESFGLISRLPVTWPAPVPARAVALGPHLPTKEDDHADDEGHANYQRWSKRREVLPHGTVLPASHRGRCSRWACAVSCVTPMLISPLR